MEFCKDGDQKPDDLYEVGVFHTRSDSPFTKKVHKSSLKKKKYSPMMMTKDDSQDVVNENDNVNVVVFHRKHHPDLVSKVREWGNASHNHSSSSSPYSIQFSTLKKVSCILNILLVITFLLSIALVTLHSFAVDKIIKNFILNKLVISSDSEMSQIWQEPPISPHLKIYFYNFTNVQEFFEGKSATPLFSEVGPYVYSQHWKKVNVSWDDEMGTVSYATRKTFKYVPHLSGEGLTQHDMIRGLNTPLISAFHQMRKANPFMVFGLEAAIESLQYQPWSEHTVEELVWGYDEPLLGLASFASTDAPDFTKFGFFHQMNFSENLPTYTMMSGMKGPSNVSKLTHFLNKSHLSFWKSDECNGVKGSDGAIYKPYLSKDDELFLFNDKLCRSIPLVYDSSVDWFRVAGDGRESAKSTTADITDDPVKAFRFLPHKDVFTSAERDCYCVSSSMCDFISKFDLTIPNLFDISSCQFGAPIILSYAHFYNPSKISSQSQSCYESQKSLKDVWDIQMESCKSKHEFYIDIDPVTGTSVEAKAKMQINIALLKNDKFQAIKHVTEDTLIPVLWFDEGINSIGDSKSNPGAVQLATLISDATLQPIFFKSIILYVAIFVISVAILITISLCVLHFVSKKVRFKHTMSENAGNIQETQGGQTFMVPVHHQHKGDGGIRLGGFMHHSSSEKPLILREATLSSSSDENSMSCAMDEEMLTVEAKCAELSTTNKNADVSSKSAELFSHNKSPHTLHHFGGGTTSSDTSSTQSSSDMTTFSSV